MRQTHYFSSERMLHKEYDRKGSVAPPLVKNSLVMSLKRLGAKTE
jgi:hypothetical protein